MSNLVLNQAPVLLARDESATLDFAPAADLLVSFENATLAYTAKGSYSQGGAQPQYVTLNEGQLIPSSAVVSGNGSNITLANRSDNPNAEITAGVFGMGEPTNGYIETNGSEDINQYHSVLAVTKPAWQKIRLTAASTNSETVVYLFSSGQTPKGYVLNYTGSGDTAFETTTGNQYEIMGNWSGNAVFLINVSNSPDLGVNVALVDA